VSDEYEHCSKKKKDRSLSDWPAGSGDFVENFYNNLDEVSEISEDRRTRQNRMATIFINIMARALGAPKAKH
jgi:hypothetical protein